MSKDKIVTGPTPQQKFETNVSLDDFMSRANPKGALREAVKGAKGIVSTGDIKKLYENTPNSNLSVARVPDSELIRLLRLIKEGGEKEVFAEADIKFDKVHVQSVSSIQTFVNIKRVAATPQANSFLTPLGIGLNLHSAYTVTIENSDGKYVSILLPPIVTNFQKSYYEAPLSNLEEQVSSGQTIIIKSVEGDVSLNLAALLKSFKAKLADPSTSTIPVVLDGTHRAFVCYMADIPMSAIVIKGDDSPRNVPVRFDDIVVALERPAKPEERYLGIVRTLPKLNLADLGIGQNR